MYKSLHSRARTVVTTGLVAALVVAGVSFAQKGGGDGGKSEGKARSGKRMPPPPPGGPLGKAGKDLTYGQLHVQRNGEGQVIRIDAGKVVSTSDSSITLKENDGNEVTVEVDDQTKVLAGPGKSRSVTDLKEGQQVVVCGPEDGAAKAIMLPPKRGKMPPPGGRFGGPQGGPPQMQG